MNADDKRSWESTTGVTCAGRVVGWGELKGKVFGEADEQGEERDVSKWVCRMHTGC